ncbi:MAG: hypothetical protein EB015_16320, partial [Methylocystaceae bacterium]|nr:hypothetical protein [Methylocystaceae bacterium]
VIATPTPKLALKGDAAMQEVVWTKQGRMQFGIELRVVDENMKDLPRDGETPGSLLVRGPWTIERYFGDDKSAVDADGWFDTGDIATLDADGFMRITDRQKDVIKSGGEWISSIDIENIAVACPGVRIAAVIGVLHPKWEERPILIIEPQPDCTLTADQVNEFLEPRIVKWWRPDAIIIEHVPLTATGKIDKKQSSSLEASLLEAVDDLGESILNSIYPLRVLQVLEGGMVVINQGGETLKVNQALTAMQLGEQITDPYTKEPLGQVETPVAEILIDRVDPKLSYGRVVSGKVSLGDEYILRKSRNNAAAQAKQPAASAPKQDKLKW